MSKQLAVSFESVVEFFYLFTLLVHKIRFLKQGAKSQGNNVVLKSEVKLPIFFQQVLGLKEVGLVCLP